MKVKLIILCLIISRISFAQSSDADKNIRAGNEFYKQQQFDKAASEYGKAIEADPNNGTAKFNLANTLYKQNKQDEAVKAFTEIVGNAEKGEFKAKVYYNKGAILSRQKKLEESIEAYKNALRLNPDDKEARENLQKALLELKKKNPPKKKEEQKEATAAKTTTIQNEPQRSTAKAAIAGAERKGSATADTERKVEIGG